MLLTTSHQDVTSRAALPVERSERAEGPASPSPSPAQAETPATQEARSMDATGASPASKLILPSLSPPMALPAHLRPPPSSVDPTSSPTPSSSTFQPTAISTSQLTEPTPALVDHAFPLADAEDTELVTGKLAACELQSPVLESDPLEPPCGQCGGPTPTVVLHPSADIVAKGERAVKALASEFDRFGIPSDEAVLDAGNCELVGESGATVLFSTLVRERERVVVVFLRHLWCGLCQEYVVALKSASRTISTLSTTTSSNSTSGTSSASSINAVTTTNFSTLPPLYILLISSGSPSLIPIYRARLECPFPLYVDKSRKLYKALGMTRKSWSMGRESEKGSYATKSKLGNVLASSVNGIAMPRYPGDQRQLGGEFVFSSRDASTPIKCLYASRMSTTRNHSEVRELFAAAGVSISSEDAASIFGESSLGEGT